MNRLDRLTLTAALVVFGAAPASVALATGRFGKTALGYYVVAGIAAAAVAAVWPLLARAKRRSARSRLDLPPLGVPIENADDPDLPQRYPELERVLTLIRQAIETGNRVGFRYRKDDGSNERRVALPRYLHERRRGGRPPSLCLNAYYGKSGRNENFSVSRMSAVELVDAPE